MGKNQAYKAMQRARLGAGSAGPEEVEDGMDVVCSLQAEKKYPESCCYSRPTRPKLLDDKLQVDGSFHSPEWHAARLASLNTSHTITWEEFKRKKKEEEMRKGELEADADRMMREYRAQLDAERACKLAQGRNPSSSKSKHGKDKRSKFPKKHSSKKRKHSRRASESSSPVSSSYSSSSDDERVSRRSKSTSKRSKKEKKHKSRSKVADDDNEDGGGPVPLSRFFGSIKS